MSDVSSRRDAVLARLASMARPGASEAMARFGITTGEAFGIPAPELRRLAREVGRDHELAEALWLVPVLDVRGFASLIEDPAAVDGAQMERWAAEFDSWAVCDAAVYAWRYSPLAPAKAEAWVAREQEFVKRAGFALMAGLAVVAKDAPDSMFEHFLDLLPRHADDARNFVKKAASWALREIGKRRPALHARAVALARELAARPAATSAGARWVGRDALRELTSAAVLARVGAAAPAPGARQRPRSVPRGTAQ